MKWELMDEQPMSRAVVAVDLQRATTSRIAGNDVASTIDNAALVVNSFRARSLPVVIAVNDLNNPPRGRTSYDRPPTAIPPEALEVVDEMGSEASDLVVTRSAWSAFTGTDLDNMLRSRGVDTVVIVGLATNFGVESTARSAYDLGYHVIVVGDAVTGPMPEANNNTLERIVPALGRVVLTKDLLREQSESPRPPTRS